MSSPRCVACGAELGTFSIWIDRGGYHRECAPATPKPAGVTEPLRQLTEDDVRRIVREEMFLHGLIRNPRSMS